MKSGSIGSVQPINKNIGLAFGKPEYISEIFPVSPPKIDLQQIPLDEKIDHTKDHKIQRRRLETAIVNTKVELNITDQSYPCSKYVQRID
ncbi:MAG: hypothetical protein EZS28_042259, partial [Streblomastix strix]